MKLNLGCGWDIRPGYTNVDDRDLHDPVPPGAVFMAYNLSLHNDSARWMWADGSVDEIMMIDVLEHFPMMQTPWILKECHRILKSGGQLVIQVPDATRVMDAIVQSVDYTCTCRKEIDFDSQGCQFCGRYPSQIARDARDRLFGGQDYPGNFHQTCFTKTLLLDDVCQAGFNVIGNDARNEQELAGDHWNMRWRFTK